MTPDGEVDPSLRFKFLDLCQALVDKGTPFTFSLTIGSTFTLSLDTRGKEEVPTILARKKPSPSTLRRNARRKELFLKRKAENTSETPEVIKKKPEAQCNWKSEVASASDPRSVKIKLTRKPSEIISQLDGHEEEATADAAVQTVEPRTKDSTVQTSKSAPTLEVSEVVQSDLPGLRVQSRYDQIGQRMEELYGPGWDKT